MNGWMLKYPYLPAHVILQKTTVPQMIGYCYYPPRDDQRLCTDVVVGVYLYTSAPVIVGSDLYINCCLMRRS